MPRATAFTLVAVGDKTSKKTELLLKYTTDRRLRKHFEPIFVNNVQNIIVDRLPYSIYFVDAESDDGYDTLRVNDYKKADCFLLCYSIADRQSFENVSKRWCIQARRSSPNAPVILVGTETEARNGASSGLVTVEEGENLKYLIGATAFVECSIEDFTGVDDVFIAAARSLRWRRIK